MLNVRVVERQVDDTVVLAAGRNGDRLLVTSHGRPGYVWYSNGRVLTLGSLDCPQVGCFTADDRVMATGDGRVAEWKLPAADDVPESPVSALTAEWWFALPDDRELSPTALLLLDKLVLVGSADATVRMYTKRKGYDFRTLKFGRPVTGLYRFDSGKGLGFVVTMEEGCLRTFELKTLFEEEEKLVLS